MICRCVENLMGVDQVAALPSLYRYTGGKTDKSQKGREEGNKREKS